jgi:anti-anti-sigma factor
MRDSILQLQTRRDGAQVVIHCAGELDFSVAGELRQAVDAACTPGTERLRVDMSDLTFIDSSGLQCLLEAHVWCESHDARFEVVASRAVQRVLDIAGALFGAPQPDEGDANPDHSATPAE